MATRPQGTKYAKVAGIGKSNNKLIMTGIGNLYSVAVNWRGATAGDRVLIHDGTDDTGPVMEEIIINNANSTPENISVPLPAVGKEFGKGLYVNVEGVTGGEVNISIGYDGNA